MLLIDKDIRKLSSLYSELRELHGGSVQCLERPLLSPFSEAVQEGGVISYGLSHAGYDLRLGYTALVFKNTHVTNIDPKEFKKNDAEYKSRLFEKVEVEQGERIWIPPNGYILAYSLEYISLPRNLKGRCVGKSTLARAGILVNTTPLEPGWHGHLTIEIANVTPCPTCLYAGEGCAQLEFELLTGFPESDYESKGGKYQGQGSEPVPSRVK